MNYRTQKHKPIRISKGKYTYRGYALENLDLPPVITEELLLDPTDGSWLEIFGHLKH